MKVRGIRKEHIEIEVDPCDVLRQLMEDWALTQGFDYISKGKLMVEQHSWTSCVGDALPHQIQYWEAFELVMEIAQQSKK